MENGFTLPSRGVDLTQEIHSSQASLRAMLVATQPPGELIDFESIDNNENLVTDILTLNVLYVLRFQSYNETSNAF